MMMIDDDIIIQEKFANFKKIDTKMFSNAASILD